MYFEKSTHTQMSVYLQFFWRMLTAFSQDGGILGNIFFYIAWIFFYNECIVLLWTMCFFTLYIFLLKNILYKEGKRHCTDKELASLAICFYKYSFIGKQLQLFIYLVWLAAFALQWLSGIVLTEILWPEKPKICINLFREKVWQPLV